MTGINGKLHDRNAKKKKKEDEAKKKEARPTNKGTKLLNQDKLGGLILPPEYLFDSSRKLTVVQLTGLFTLVAAIQETSELIFKMKMSLVHTVFPQK